MDIQLKSAVKRILENRGISAADAAEYLSDTPKTSYDPFLMKNMEEACDVILSAIEDGIKICVYGDYDADGVTSVTVLTDVIREIGGNVIYYIPSRFDEGYGLNSIALDRVKEEGCGLVITVDCGCTSVKEVEHAKEIGLDIIITDHHELKEEIPDCIVVDPKQKDCPYPCKVLAGVGVAFKLSQALCSITGMPKRVLTRNLDLVGIGTIGDIVPLLDENRTLAKFGLRVANISDRIGLKSLIEGIGFKQGNLDSQSVSFGLVPHINASGRMGKASYAAKLMKTSDEKTAEELVEKLKEYNYQRKRIQGEIAGRCEAMITEEMLERGALILKVEDAHEGVIGIVCGKLKDGHSMPVILVTRIEDGSWKGTGRSVDGIDIFQILKEREDIFIRFGGHAAACGFTISEENLPILEKHIYETMARLKEEGKIPEKGVKAEIEMEPDEVSFDFVDEQKLMEPFGKSNPKPVVGVRFTPLEIARMGNEGRFLRCRGRLRDGKQIRIVDFKNADRAEVILSEAMNEGTEVHAIGALEDQMWNGNRYLQINLSWVE